MSNEIGKDPNLKKFGATKRKSLAISQESLIKTRYLNTDDQFPLVIEPNVDDMNLIDWTQNNLEFIEAKLLKHAAILFHGFQVDTIARFEQFVRTISPELLDYQERAAPRVEISKNVFTSTEFPANQLIPLHHEMSYSHNWPTKIWFFCVQPAQQDGRTPIANDRTVFGRIDPAIKNRFIEKKVMYVRNYGEGIDLSWQEAFQTNDRAAVEAYCHKTHMAFEWRDKDRLRTRALRQVVVTHPKTGDMVWFNHAHMFHGSNLEPTVREALLAHFKEDELPRNVFYGDGSPIEDSVLDEIRGIYQQAAVSAPWQQGDILMLDNILASHGREPFVGPRRIVVAMADLFTNPV